MQLLGGRGGPGGGGTADDFLHCVPQGQVVFQNMSDQEAGQRTEPLEGTGLGEGQEQLDAVELSEQSERLLIRSEPSSN